MKKKIIAMLLVITTCTFIYNSEKQRCQAFGILTATTLCVVTKLLLSAGATWFAVDTAKRFYDTFKDEPVVKEIETGLTTVKDGIYHVSDSLWTNFKSFVQSKFVEGNSNINVGQQTWVDLSNSTISLTEYPYQATFHISNAPDITYLVVSKSKFWFEKDTYRINNISESNYYYFENGTWQYNCTGKFWTGNPISFLQSNCDIYDSLDCNNIYFHKTVPYDYYGDAVVADKNWDWTNPNTGDRSICVPTNLPVDANSVIDENLLNEYLDRYIGADKTKDVIINELPDVTNTQSDVLGWLETIWNSVKSIPQSVAKEWNKLWNIERDKDLATDISGEVTGIREGVETKFNCPKLVNSLNRIQNINVARGNPPKFSINLFKLYNASAKRFGSGPGTLADKETEFFDFATLNQYKFMGIPLPDWTYNVVGFGMLYLTALYVWNRLHPKEALN